MPEDLAPTVCVGYVHDKEVAHSWSDSLIQAGFFDGGRTLRGVIKVRSTTGMIEMARNDVAREFLERNEEYLWNVDTDMGFLPDTLAKLSWIADPEERPFIGALTFAQKEVEHDGYSGSVCKPRPVLVDLMDVTEKGETRKRYAARGWYAPNAMTRVSATGMACCLIHRSVFERIRDHYGGDVWFDRLPGMGADADKLMGEDVSFCHRCNELGIPIYCHTGIRTTHLKPIWLGEPDFWQAQVAPPATERALVIVPVLNRPANAKPFMESLRASTGMADAVAVADEDDILTIAAWQEQGVDVLKGREHTFAEKLNRGYRERMNGTPWLFMVGDDVQFYPGWLDHAEWMADSFKAKVVGTNDLGNPRVIAGEHATHMLISAEYIKDQGAGWDGPGVVAHEGYRHWFVDDEIVTAAKQRGVFMPALGSIVEHKHFLWGKSSVDPTYEEGNRHATEDRAVFEKRHKEFTGEELEYADRDG